MADRSKIEWCDATFNPWIGCTKVSPGCDHCYAEAWDRRFAVSGHAMHWGAGKARRRTSESNWHQPLRWNAAHDAFFAAHGRRRRVFCASLADVFDNEVPAQWRGALWNLVRETPSLVWLLLTKRIGNVIGMLPADWFDGWPNVWLGATVVNQAEADRDIQKLLDTPAAVRFVSIEPMLGPITLPFLRKLPCYCHDGGLHPRIDWVICGSESGSHARRDPAMHEWVRSLRDQCVAAGVAFFWKQDAERGRKIPAPELDGRSWTEFPAEASTC